MLPVPLGLPPFTFWSLFVGVFLTLPYCSDAFDLDPLPFGHVTLYLLVMLPFTSCV